MATPDRNPQAEQMADESMVRNLASQADAIWPQERELLLREPPAAGARVLDVGCGTGEITRRVAELFPAASVEGVDLLPEHLAVAADRSAGLGDRVRYRVGDAYALDAPDGAYDLVLCRHLLQAIPDAERVVAELLRVTRPGGRLHVVAEDYAMMHFAPLELDGDRFWQDGPIRFARATGSDLTSGRKMFTYLVRAGAQDVRVDYVTVDTQRVPRDVFAAIWVAWRDGYSEAIARHTRFELEEVHAHFDAMIACIRDPEGYAVWQLPVIRGRAPDRGA